MIKRSSPDIGYLGPEIFKTFAFSQTVRTGNTVYLSGIGPLRGDLKNLEVVGKGDIRAQVEWCLEVLKRCLAAEGATFRNLVTMTTYMTNLAELSKAADIFVRVFGEHTPAGTGVEVKALFHPEQMIEITAIAVLES